MIRLILAAIIAAGPAFGQTPNCADRARVIADLSVNYGETRQSIGLAVNNVIVETFANAKTGSWTITVTTPAGVTCLIASGTAFEAVGVTGDPA